MFEVKHFKLVELVVQLRLFLHIYVFRQTLNVLGSSVLLASVTVGPALEVIVATLAALPAPRREDAFGYLVLGLLRVVHFIVASVAPFAPFEVVVVASVAVPPSSGKFEVVLSVLRLEVASPLDLELFLTTEVARLEAHLSLVWVVSFGSAVVVVRILTGLIRSELGNLHFVLSVGHEAWLGG